MSKNLTAIYEGDGILRLLDVPSNLQAQQHVQIQIIESLSEPDKPSQPSAEAVWADMGLVPINDADLAHWLAESEDLIASTSFFHAELR